MWHDDFGFVLYNDFVLYGGLLLSDGLYDGLLPFDGFVLCGVIHLKREGHTLADDLRDDRGGPEGILGGEKRVKRGGRGISYSI